MIILISLALIVFGGALGGTLWLVSRARRSAKATKTARDTAAAGGLSFRWQYIVLPVAFLLLSILLSAYFYNQLPAEVATHFELDGTPDRWLGRSATMLWVLIPQLLLTLLAIAVVWGITRISSLFNSAASTWIRPERVLLFMGNALALPQIVLGFAMLDIFSYNSYQRHIMPMWLFLLVLLGLAAIAMLVLLARIILRAWRQSFSRSQVTRRSESDDTETKS